MPPDDTAPTTETLTILYEDDLLVAVHKPAGLLVHKSPIDRHETRYAMRILRDQIGQHVFPVHRLDKPTSGLLLFAKDADTAAIVAQQFEARQVQKCYIALVRGWPNAHGTIDHPLRHVADFKHQAEAAKAKEAQDATTTYRRMTCYELPWPDGRFTSSRYSLIGLAPHTGRKHQLRRHLKHIAHPIIGDVKYGKGPHNRLFREQLHCHRLLLAATTLSLTHPQSGNTLVLQCPLESDFAQLLETLQQWRADL